MSKPTLPSRPGQDVTKISASWLGRLLDCVAYAMDYPQGDNKTCRRNGDFIEIFRAPGGGQSAVAASGAFPCKITGGSNAAGYTVEIYANGKSAAATGTGLLEVLELAMDDNLTAGTWVIGHQQSVSVTGGTE